MKEGMPSRLKSLMSLRAKRGNLIVGGGIAWAEGVPCSGKVVLEIASSLALLAKTVEEYVSQASGLSSPDGSSCPVSKTAVP